MTTATNSTTEPRFNLTVEPWIPVVWRDGRRTPERVSLRDAFALGTEVLDLAGRPHERVALLRLLICIAQAALKGPSTRAEWKKLGPPHDRDFSALKAKLAAYLEPHDDAHRDGRFWLFHPVSPFLQVVGLSAAPVQKKAGIQSPAGTVRGASEPATTEKNVELLELRFARDETSTLLDQFAGTRRKFGDAELAVMLLTYLNFAPGQLIARLQWNGTPLRDQKGNLPGPKGQPRACTAPCAVDSAIHAFLVGESLLHTIHLNMVIGSELERLGHTKNDFGQAAWELTVEELKHRNERPAIATGLLERLVPLSRFVSLRPNGQTAILANGVNYSPFLLDHNGRRKGTGIRPPSAAIISNESYLCAEPGKALWRVLHTLAMVRTSEHGGKGPAMLANLEERIAEQPSARVRFAAVAILTTQATLEDVVESAFDLRAGLLLNDTAFNDYDAGLAHGSFYEDRLEKAVATYFKALKEKDRVPDLKRAAVQDFWNVLEQDAPVLLTLLDANLGEDGRYASGQIDFTNPENPWGQHVRAAALGAYRRACPCLNARQIIAHADGLKTFDRKPSKRSNKS